MSWLYLRKWNNWDSIVDQSPIRKWALIGKAKPQQKYSSTHPMFSSFDQSAQTLDSLELSCEEVEAVVEMSLRWHPLQVGVAVLALIRQEVRHQEPFNTKFYQSPYLHTQNKSWAEGTIIRILREHMLIFFLYQPDLWGWVKSSEILEKGKPDNIKSS